MKGTVSGKVGRWLKALMMKRIHNMISCREFENFVIDYQEGDLPPAQWQKFERHLRFCRECRDYFHAYQRSLQVGQALFEASEHAPPEEVPEDLIKAILRNRTASK